MHKVLQNIITGTAAGGTATSEASQGLSTEPSRVSRSSGQKADSRVDLLANVHHTAHHP